MLAQIGDDDVRSLPGVGDGDGPANPGVAAGDHRDLAPQPPVADIGCLPTVGHRIHPGLDTGRFLLLGWLIHGALLTRESGRPSSTHPPARHTPSPGNRWSIPADEQPGRGPSFWLESGIDQD